MTAMRIALYSHVFPPHIGGSGVQAKLLAEGFAALGHAVTVITATASSSAEDATSHSDSSDGRASAGFAPRSRRAISSSRSDPA
jgi:hypothetical protein